MSAAAQKPRLTGDELKALRAQAGLTQAELAAELGVNEVTMSNWETGNLIISRRMTIAIQNWARLKKLAR